ncbi:MAG: histidine kinase [Vicinamibacterales bacterium]
MVDNQGYSPRNRAERVISAWRLFLAALLTLAVLLGSGQTRRHAPIVDVLAYGYLAFALGITVLTWTRRVTTRGVPIVTQIIDLGLFCAFMFLTQGAESPFFPYFVFAIISGAIRWHGRGAVLSGAAAFVAYVLGTISGRMLEPLAPFNTAEFIARSTQLVLVGGLLAYLGSYQYRLQREIAGLAAWPRRLPTDGPEALEEVLIYAAKVLGAPRLLLAWEEGEEPSMRIAIRAGDTFEITHHRPDAFGTVVNEALGLSSFVCSKLGARHPRVLQRVSGGFRFWSGKPIDSRFQQRYEIRSAVAVRLYTESIEGWLFALDKPRPSPEDLMLGDIVGRLVASALEVQTLVAQLRESAAGEERVNLARELHDGVLQSLTAASLQAQRARLAMATSAPEAEQRLAVVEETILAEQQALRLAIADLKPGAIKETTPIDVVPRLREVATRVARQWDVRAHLNLQDDVPPVPQKMSHELTRMVQEALVNAIRHGAAKEITVTCLTMGYDLAIAVSYQGRGFAGFHGRHDLASLNEMKAGPRTLKERVSAVGGSLVIESGEGGARVEIRVPLTSTPTP